MGDSCGIIPCTQCCDEEKLSHSFSLILLYVVIFLFDNVCFRFFFGIYFFLFLCVFLCVALCVHLKKIEYKKLLQSLAYFVSSLCWCGFFKNYSEYSKCNTFLCNSIKYQHYDTIVALPYNFQFLCPSQLTQTYS